MAALERDPTSLFAGVPPPGPGAGGSPLPEMSPLETTFADYRIAGTNVAVTEHLRDDSVILASTLQ